tara:strand:- start:262 stop:414 length:153 start_codon:yes stop_codon:yes gene_type:complete
MEKDFSNLIKYKDELTKEALKYFINHLQKDIKTLRQEANKKFNVVKKLKK